MVLLKHHGLAELFSSIITKEEVKNAKPHPEPYLLSMRRSPAEIHVAFEDSHIGMKAALRAGCLTFNIKTLSNFDLKL